MSTQRIDEGPLSRMRLKDSEAELVNHFGITHSEFHKLLRHLGPDVYVETPADPDNASRYFSFYRSTHTPKSSPIDLGMRYTQVHIGTLQADGDISASSGSSPIKIKPPINAEFLFHLFLDLQNCDALVGDLEERYKLIHKKFGRRHANFWYWTQAVRSLGPIVWAWGKKVSMKPVVALVTWAVAKGLIGHDGWVAALVELWKRVRS